MIAAPLRADYADLAPLLRRVDGLNPAALVRLRHGSGLAAAWVRLPFGVLAARTTTAASVVEAVDTTVAARDLLAWLTDEAADAPRPRDTEWRGALPPTEGWQRVDTVPDDVVRKLVRSGALALKEAAAREGVPGAQPRAEVADALLDAVVLTVTGAAGARAEVTLRSLSALTRLGFLPRGSHIGVDVCRRWTRVAAAYGSVFAERRGAGLDLAG